MLQSHKRIKKYLGVALVVTVISSGVYLAVSRVYEERPSASVTAQASSFAYPTNFWTSEFFGPQAPSSAAFSSATTWSSPITPFFTLPKFPSTVPSTSSSSAAPAPAKVAAPMRMEIKTSTTTATEKLYTCAVCQYDKEPACSTGTLDTCYKIHKDCKWYYQENACKSFQQWNCEQFLATSNVDKKILITNDRAEKDLPAQIKDCKTVQYDISEHSDASQCERPFSRAILCINAMPNCSKIQIQDSGCSTFENVELADAYAEKVRKLLPKNVSLFISGNQMDAVKDICTTKLNYIIDCSGVTRTAGNCHANGDYCAEPGASALCFDPVTKKERKELCCPDSLTKAVAGHPSGTFYSGTACPIAACQPIGSKCRIAAPLNQAQTCLDEKKQKQSEVCCPIDGLTGYEFYESKIPEKVFTRGNTCPPKCQILGDACKTDVGKTMACINQGRPATQICCEGIGNTIISGTSKRYDGSFIGTTCPTKPVCHWPGKAECETKDIGKKFTCQDEQGNQTEEICCKRDASTGMNEGTGVLFRGSCPDPKCSKQGTTCAKTELHKVTSCIHPERLYTTKQICCPGMGVDIGNGVHGPGYVLDAGVCPPLPAKK